MADVMTFEEHRGPIAGRRIAWTGDANNVLRSLVHAAARFEFELAIAMPPAFGHIADVEAWLAAEGCSVTITDDPREAVAGAAAVVTDTWVSMGDGESAAERRAVLAPFRVDEALMALAAPDAIFMHCLPAHRGDEVTAAVIDGPQSVVFDEAENRLHAQKAILAWCFDVEAA
jgi:ornithine carbamoyltransferase